MTSPQPSRERLGSVLVAAQLLLMGVLAVAAAPLFLFGQAPLAAWVPAAAGAAVGLWALTHNRPRNFSIRPTPRADGHLVHTGPYRWIRHPMYTAVMLCAGAAAWAAASGWGWAAAAALVAVLATQAHVVGRWMLQRHPGYAAYREGTRRFLPFLV